LAATRLRFFFFFVRLSILTLFTGLLHWSMTAYCASCSTSINAQ